MKNVYILREIKMGKPNLLNFLSSLKIRLKALKYVTNAKQMCNISKIRDINGQQIRDIKSAKAQIASQDSNLGPNRPGNYIPSCPYCSGKDTVKKGLRKKKLETIQLYYCNGCKRVFTPQKIKGKTFPLKIILDGISYYNTGFTLAESCKFLKEKTGIEVKEPSLANWIGVRYVL